MPTITVEDGSIVADANSYIAVADLDTFATTYGVTIPTDQTVKEQYLLLATAYLEARASDYSGELTDADNQVLQWPRYGAYLDKTVEIESNSIPQVLKDAQAWLVVEQEKGTPLYPDAATPDTAKGGVRKEALGPLVQEFFRSDAPSKYHQTRIAQVDSLLDRISRFGAGTGIVVSRA